MRRKYKRNKYGTDLIIWPLFFIGVGLWKSNRFTLSNISLISTYKVLGGFIGIVILMNVIKQFRKKKQQSTRRKKYLDSGIAAVDKMEGSEFEHFLLAHFETFGFKGYVTQASNDYGADLILKKDGLNTIVQAKRYSSKVGIKAVQEIVAAKNYFNADQMMVVTNNYFTKPARELADSNNVELWDRSNIISIMNQNGSEATAKEIIKKATDDMKCPRCKSSLVLKEGYYGSFYGCSKYPKCDFTRNKER